LVLTLPPLEGSQDDAITFTLYRVSRPPSP
jgi:hypothetical protein